MPMFSCEGLYFNNCNTHTHTSTKKGIVQAIKKSVFLRHQIDKSCFSYHLLGFNQDFSGFTTKKNFKTEFNPIYALLKEQLYILAKAWQ